VQVASHCSKLTQAELAWQAIHCASQKACSQVVQAAPGPPVEPDDGDLLPEVEVVPDEGEVAPDDALEPLAEVTL
jgi:hypothetical protein